MTATKCTFKTQIPTSVAYETVEARLSGLAAVHLGLRFPTHFPRIITQSPSAWWNDEWITEETMATSGRRVPMWISVGGQETEEGVTHEPGMLYQGVTQIDSCTRLA